MRLALDPWEKRRKADIVQLSDITLHIVGTRNRGSAHVFGVISAHVWP